METKGYNSTQHQEAIRLGYFLDASQVQALLEMAIKGIVPDESYSDFECAMFCEMRRILKLNGIEVQ